MSGLPKDFWRSNASFLSSFLIHVVLILVLALCLVVIPGPQTISLTSQDDDLLETVPFDYSNEHAEAAAAAAASELDENTLTEPVVQDAPEIAWTQDLNSSLENTDWMSDLMGSGTGSGADETELVDGEASPELRDVGFFGIEPTGQRIVYVLDMSVSMGYSGYYGPRYTRAVSELMRSVEQLRPDQRFYVILFCFATFEMDIGTPPGQFVSPTAENKDRLGRWLTNIQLGPGTDPRVAIVRALELKPSCVFLLSDGEFNGSFFDNPPYGKRSSAVTLARTRNPGHCPIHTIGLEDKANQKDLSRISKESGGRYKFVSGDR